MSPGFPGTILAWTIDAGTTTVTEIDGGLHVDAPRCLPLPTRLTASAVRSVPGEQFNRVSSPGTLVIDVEATAPPLNANTDFSISVQGDGGVLFGILELDAGWSDEGCLGLNGVIANVMAFKAGTLVSDGGFSPEDGGWSLQVPGGCAGGTYDVVADLYEKGVFTGATARGSITLSFSPARVGDLEANRLEVVCGAGARTAVTLLRAPSSCAAADVTWRAIGGPPLVTMEGQGERLELQSEALDFSVVGQQVTLEFVADAGPGNLDTANRTIELSVQPFLEVTVKARPPLRREEEAVALDVTLLNTTTCAVDGISVTLPLSGGSPLLDSVLIDGRRVTARLTDDGVVIDGVSVPAAGSVTLQLSARARLLSSPSVVPVASLNGYVVSMNAPLTAPATGCGCSQLDGSALLALILLVSARRRRA